MDETGRMLSERGWVSYEGSLWSVIIGGFLYAYNTEKGLLTTQQGYDTNLIQKKVTLTDVLALGFADDWGSQYSRLRRDKAKLENLYHQSDS